MEKRTVFFVMVMHPAKGWTRVGNAYPSRKAAADWMPFVRGAWRGLRTKVSQCTLRLDGGKVCEQSRRLLDEKYNLDAERKSQRRRHGVRWTAGLAGKR